MAVRPPDADLKAAVQSGDVLFVVGTGVSSGATGRHSHASWEGLIGSGIDECQSIMRFTMPQADHYRGLLAVKDPDDLLVVATAITKKLGGRQGGDYRGWIRKTVGQLKASNRDVLEALADLPGILATTNYDGLLEEVTGRDPYTWRQSNEVERVLRGDQPGIIHLHGFWKDSESVVLDIVDYAEIVGAQHAQTMLKAMRTMKTLVFVGCGEGLVDPNLGALFKWTRDVFAGSEFVHYVLAVESEVDKLRKQHPPEERLRVIPYGPNYSDLGPFLRSLKPSVSGPGSSGGGGSAGGRGGKMHAAAASSPPAGSSSLRPFRNRSLLQRLTMLLQDMKLPWSTIEESFWESVPETWPGQLLDESAAEAERYKHLVDVLSGLPEQVSTGRTFPLLEFVLRSRNYAATSVGALDSWLKDAARHLGVSSASLMAQEQKIAGERHVLVKIERATSEQFLLQAWLGDERGNMQALLDEPQRCKREELPRVVGELWSSSDRRKRLGLIDQDKLTVEFLLPRELISEGVEQWRIPPGRLPLGCKYRVVVRPLERVYTEVKQFLDEMADAAEAWRTKWGLFSGSTTEIDSLLWLRRPEELNEDRLQALLLREKVISLLLILTPPTCSESLRREVLSRAVEQGLPIALWVRLEEAAPDSVEELFTQLSKDLRQLRHAVRQVRVDALGKPEDDKHLGRYLSLLWDDPDHRPPDSQPDDYSAPIQHGVAS